MTLGSIILISVTTKSIFEYGSNTDYMANCVAEYPAQLID